MKLDIKPTKTSVGLTQKHYTDSFLFEQELRSVWHHTWQFVGRDEDIAEPGDYFTCTLGKEPIVVMRLPDFSLRAMHNVCRHRGARLLDDRGHCESHITCPYHAWTYDRDGQLLGVTKAKWFANLDKSAIQLLPAQVDTWNGFIFVNADVNSEPLADYLAEMTDFFGQYHQDWASLREVDRWFYDEPVNWKLIVENYVEDYHFDIVHDSSFKELYDLDNIQTLPTGRHIKVPIPYNSKSPKGFYEKFWEEGQVSYQGYIFPDMMINTDRENVSIFRLIPLGAESTRVEVIIYQSPLQFADVLYQRDVLRKEYDQFMEEDLHICRQIQTNMHSQAYGVTALAEMHESGIVHFHNVLSEYL